MGQFDIQFTFGPVTFAVQSSISLIRNDVLVGSWQEGKWPDAQFFEVMNVNVVRCEIPNDRLMVLHFEHGIEMHLRDDSDQYECMQILIEGNPTRWII